MITTVEMRMFLDRNPNALKAVPQFRAGERVERGLYWDPAARRVEVFEQAGSHDRDLIRLSPNPDATVDELVARLAIGGGGRTGDPDEVRAGR